jgi:hypothetical protein
MYTRPMFLQQNHAVSGFGDTVTVDADGNTTTSRYSQSQKTVFRALLAAGIVTVGAVIYFQLKK